MAFDTLRTEWVTWLERTLGMSLCNIILPVSNLFALVLSILALITIITV